MINNLDNKSKKTRKTLQVNLLQTPEIKTLIKNDPKYIFWNYSENDDLYTKVTAEIENGQVILKDQKHNVIKKDSLFRDKKIMLSYQRAPKTKMKTKKDLLREALGQTELKILIKKGVPTVWGFSEVEQNYKRYNIVEEDNSIVLKNENNETEKFIDAIFKSEHEVKAYQNTSFM